MIYNKRKHIDARNALGNWSFLKGIVDTIFVLAGGGILAHQPNVEMFSLVFLLWIWTLIKEVVDIPLVVIWAYGKYHHMRRKKKRRIKATINE